MLDQVFFLPYLSCIPRNVLLSRGKFLLSSFCRWSNLKHNLILEIIWCWFSFATKQTSLKFSGRRDFSFRLGLQRALWTPFVPQTKIAARARVQPGLFHPNTNVHRSKQPTKMDRPCQTGHEKRTPKQQTLGSCQMHNGIIADAPVWQLGFDALDSSQFLQLFVDCLTFPMQRKRFFVLQMITSICCTKNLDWE